MAQSVERRIGSAEVTGPIPVSSFFYCPKKSMLSGFTKFGWSFAILLRTAFIKPRKIKIFAYQYAVYALKIVFCDKRKALALK